MPPGLLDHSVLTTWRTVSCVLNGRPEKLYSHAAPIDGSLSISACRPPALVSAQLPSLLWKNESSRFVAVVLPPIRSNSARGLKGIIQVYWAALPSANPLLLAGLNDGKLPLELRFWMYPMPAAAGFHTFFQNWARVMNSWCTEVRPSRSASCAMPKSATESSSVSPAPPHALPSVGM